MAYSPFLSYTQGPHFNGGDRCPLDIHVVNAPDRLKQRFQRNITMQFISLPREYRLLHCRNGAYFGRIQGETAAEA